MSCVPVELMICGLLEWFDPAVQPELMCRVFCVSVNAFYHRETPRHTFSFLVKCMLRLTQTDSKNNIGFMHYTLYTNGKPGNANYIYVHCCWVCGGWKPRLRRYVENTQKCVLMKWRSTCWYGSWTQSKCCAHFDFVCFGDERI